MGIACIDEDSVKFAQGVVACKRRETKCNKGGALDLLHVLRDGEGVAPVFRLLADVRCRGFFWYDFAVSFTLLFCETLLEPSCMEKKESA